METWARILASRQVNQIFIPLILSRKVEKRLKPMRKFCYKCGALEEDVGRLVKGLCLSCFSREFHLLEVPPKLEITLCRSCGAVKSSGRWLGGKDSVEREILRHVSFNELPGTTEKPQVEIRVNLQRRNAEISAGQEFMKQVLEEKRRIELELKYQTCSACSRKHGAYYEVIVQIRAPGNLERLESTVRRLAVAEGEKSPRDFLVDAIRVKNGIDVYLSSVGLGRKILSWLRREGAEVKESKKLIGQTRNGKRRYRFAYVARFGGA